MMTTKAWISEAAMQKGVQMEEEASQVGGGNLAESNSSRNSGAGRVSSYLLDGSEWG